MQFVTRVVVCGAVACGLAAPLAAQQTAKATIDNSETLFSVMAVLNSCGYDRDLDNSLPVRTAIRTDLGNMLTNNDAAAQELKELCSFYRDHAQNDGGRDLAQYISLALSLGPPPDFEPTVKEADLPPDAAYVLGLAPPLRDFYKAADLHRIWLAHQSEYAALLQQFHDKVASTLLQTDLYIRLPISGYLGRRFVVFLDPQIAPGQVNARTYGSDYFLVMSPTSAGFLNLDQVRHTYLHYVLEPLLLKRVNSLKRFLPLLDAVKSAPLDAVYKEDITALVTESLVRAVEARMLGNGKAPLPVREASADHAVSEGFILTRYFFDALQRFESEPVGLQDALADMLYQIDVEREKKRANEVQFAAAATPEVVQPKKSTPHLLDLAEESLAKGDIDTAQTLARRAFDDKQEDPARALFILARAATLRADMPGARTYFERALEVAREPRIVAWSHIYLGRILDLQENRVGALLHYRAALSAGDTTPDTRAAAERGIEKPYAPVRR